MRWGHRAFLAPVAVLAVLAPGAQSVAAKPLLGTVQRGWISKVEPGVPVKTVKSTQKVLYANFIWKRSPTAKLPLEMRWVGPSGFVRAAWKSQTLKSDTAGTRLYSRVTNDVFKGAPGNWEVRLLVNNVVRGRLVFRVTS
jgi:hypothetical protein